jgi:hypothetical protein
MGGNRSLKLGRTVLWLVVVVAICVVGHPEYSRQMSA